MNHEQDSATRLTMLAATAMGLDLTDDQIRCIWTPLNKDDIVFRMVTALKLGVLFVENQKEIHVSNQEGTLVIRLPYTDLNVDKQTRLAIVTLAAAIGETMRGSVTPSEAIIHWLRLEGSTNGSITV